MVRKDEEERQFRSPIPFISPLLTKAQFAKSLPTVCAEPRCQLSLKAPEEC